MIGFYFAIKFGFFLWVGWNSCWGCFRCYEFADTEVQNKFVVILILIDCAMIQGFVASVGYCQSFFICIAILSSYLCLFLSIFYYFCRKFTPLIFFKFLLKYTMVEWTSDDNSDADRVVKWLSFIFFSLSGNFLKLNKYLLGEMWKSKVLMN